MKIVNVAVLDSGLSSYMNAKLSKDIIGGCSYELSGTNIKSSHDYHDSCMHGTMCLSLINSFSSNAKFYIMKVLNQDCRTHDILLINALHQLKKMDIKVINLSLATKSDENEKEFKDVCTELCNEGKILISSQANNFTGRSYPCSLNNVIGVEGGNFYNNDMYWFNNNLSVQCVADGTPVITRVNDDYFFFKGNSKATALFTAKIINKIASNRKDIDYRELCKELENESKNNSWDLNNKLGVQNFDIDKVHNKQTAETVKKVEGILINFFKTKSPIEDRFHGYMFDKKNGFNIGICTNLLRILKEDLSLNINYNKVSILDFYDLDTLCSAIYGKWVGANYEDIV